VGIKQRQRTLEVFSVSLYLSEAKEKFHSKKIIQHINNILKSKTWPKRRLSKDQTFYKTQNKVQTLHNKKRVCWNVLESEIMSIKEPPRER
jgi:hypothetical protein